MKAKHWLIIAVAAVLALNAIGEQLDTATIEQIIGVKGTMNTNENVFKIAVPRTDVKVSVDGWPMPPFMGVGSWVAFTPGMNDTMVMGDTALFQDEVNPVMSVALDNGLAVTALHNHFFYDEPRVFFMHISGEGSAENLAAAVKRVWDKIKEIRAANPVPATVFGNGPMPAKNSITGEPIEKILGVKGMTNNGMFKVVIGRPAQMSGVTLGADMGVNTWAAFAGTDDNALVDGDFAVHEDELQGVLKSLRNGGINIVAIHNHMAGETPRTLFLHYWGRGKAAALAQTLKAALNTQGK